MDGFKRRLNDSVQLKLSFSLSVAILMVAVAAGVFSFASAFDEAHELQDGTLRQIAGLSVQQALRPAAPGNDNRTGDSDEDSIVLVPYPAGGSKAQVDARFVLPAMLSDGLHTLNIGGEQFRVLVKTGAGGERIAVAQGTIVRDEIARDSALRTVMPLLVLVPVLLLIVADMVRKLFRPIASLASDIDQRGEQELHPIAEGYLPAEVRPFAVAINRLLARVEQAMETQRRFVADAAHELRSPLTALSLQAERLAEADMSLPARERLHTLRLGIERGRGLLDQLLMFAKAQAVFDRPKSPISVQHIYRRVLEDLMPLAEAKKIDIGVEGKQDAQIWAHEPDLIMLAKNLIDNAIRYTPEGGKVDLSVTMSAGLAILRIQDSGPGIPPLERARVFDPFYRMLGGDHVGSGLGLAIAKSISERIGAVIQLDASDEQTQTGLCVSVLVPVGNIAGILSADPG